MSTALEQTIQALEQVVKQVPIGTNLALLHLLWTMLRGAFLRSRGAVFPALQLAGFTAAQIRRCGQALRRGAWEIDDLIQSWRGYVLDQGEWEPHSYEGYRPLAVDLTAFWRPRLKGWIGKFFHPIVKRARKGIGLGIIAQVGHIGEQRIPLLKRIVCACKTVRSESQLKRKVLKRAGQELDESEVVVHDAGATVADMQTAEVERYVVRMACNCTARRNYLPPRKARGRPPEYGELIRPLPRTWKDRSIPATPPDMETRFQLEGRTICVYGWRDVVRRDQRVATDNDLFTIWVFFDPLYDDPLVLGTNVEAKPKTIFQLYLDRWPVEQIPLVAKQLLGLQRQFVFAPASRQRLPELALLAANILTHLAAALPPLPTGFWDLRPERTPGRLRRVLARADFPKDYAFAERIRKKRSVTAHLPKGVAAHRRQKASV